MFRITIITLILCSISLSSCLKENGRWVNSYRNSLPESGYYEWQGNLSSIGSWKYPIEDLNFVSRASEASYTAAYKLVLPPNGLPRVEFILNNQVVMSASIESIKYHESLPYFDLFDNAGSTVCSIGYCHTRDEWLPTVNYFVSVSYTNTTFDFGEGYPLFIKQE